MPVKAVVDSLDGLPEAVVGLYKPVSEGDLASKFVLDVESTHGLTLENVSGLRSALENTKAELTSSAAALEGFKGLDAKAVRARLKRLEDLEKIDPQSEADRLAEIKAGAKIEEITKGHEKEVAKQTKRNAVLQSEIERLVIDNAASTAIAAQRGDPDLLLPFVRGRLRVVESEDGRFSVQVLNEQGNQKYTVKDNKAVESSVEDLISEFKINPKYGRLFEATNTGSGANNTNRGSIPAGTANPWLKGQHWNLTQQMILLKTNPGLAAAMKAQAGVA
jgi:hypothetical protein